MQHDEVICAQKSHEEWYPDVLIINISLSCHFGLYLLNPGVEGPIHSPFATLNVRMTD
jgi:hypothetical protein